MLIMEWSKWNNLPREVIYQKFTRIFLISWRVNFCGVSHCGSTQFVDLFTQIENFFLKFYWAKWWFKKKKLAKSKENRFFLKEIFSRKICNEYVWTILKLLKVLENGHLISRIDGHESLIFNEILAKTIVFPWKSFRNEEFHKFMMHSCIRTSLNFDLHRLLTLKN